MEGKLSSLHPVAWLVVVGTFLSRGVYFMTIPFLAIYLHDVQGLEASSVGAILGAGLLVGTVSSFVGGWLSDRWGRFPVMVGSVLAMVLVFVGFALATETWVFLVCSMLNGLFRNLFEPAARALLADVTPQEQHLRVFSVRYFAINLGASLGPLVGVYAGSTVSTTPFTMTAGVYLLYGTLISCAMIGKKQSVRPAAQDLPKKVTVREALRVVLRDRVFRNLLIGQAFVCTAYSHLDSTLGQYLGVSPDFSNGVQWFSYLLVANAVGVLVLQAPVSKWASRFSPMRAVTLGGVSFVLSLVCFGVFQSLWLLIFGMLLFTVGEILCFVVSEVAVADLAPEGLRGVYFGATGLQFLGQSLGPWAGGLLLDGFGYDHGAVVFGILAGLTLLALPFYRAGEKSLRKGDLEHEPYTSTL
ncbi:MFS transporter [Tumebacillus sp. ITR2]|uniref:MFS transporter n=1 Tax=Tumebacillus amylolyticus TaxID=2801339 RepID=A0ABS1J4K6_9BACL|nr:MFS transporter [Tumebacillus amylolyticus]MBL0385214.1 MFS transporter [Tumebacillus amylolyticus]